MQENNRNRAESKDFLCQVTHLFPRFSAKNVNIIGSLKVWKSIREVVDPGRGS